MNMPQMQRPPMQRPPPDLVNRLGSGTYGDVVKVRAKGDPTRFQALKKAKETAKEDGCLLPSVFRELVLLNEIHYPHINHIYNEDINWRAEPPGVQFRYDFGVVDVRKIVEFYASSSKMIPPVVVKSILFQLLLALDHLHKRKIVHCDVSTGNILVMPPDGEMPGIVKLIDFGLARVIENPVVDKRYSVVTIGYRAPELLIGDPHYTEKIDIWAAGCVFAELLIRRQLFKAEDQQDVRSHEFRKSQLQCIMKTLGDSLQDPDVINRARYKTQYREMLHAFELEKGPGLRKLIHKDILSDSGYKLLQKMLTPDPPHRISAAEALRDKFFNEEPICVLNVARHFPSEDWARLREIDNKREQK